MERGSTCHDGAETESAICDSSTASQTEKTSGMATSATGILPAVAGGFVKVNGKVGLVDKGGGFR